MTYGHPGVCRHGGCGQLVSEVRATDPGDTGWCDEHLAEVRRARFEATVGRPHPRTTSHHLGSRVDSKAGQS